MPAGRILLARRWGCRHGDSMGYHFGYEHAPRCSRGGRLNGNPVRTRGGFNIQIRGQNSLGGRNSFYMAAGVVTSNIDFLNPADKLKERCGKYDYDFLNRSTPGIWGADGETRITGRFPKTHPGYLNEMCRHSTEYNKIKTNRLTKRVK